MKKIFVLCICLSIFYTSNAQARLGSTIDEIKKEFSEYESNTWTESEGTRVFGIDMDDRVVGFKFFDDGDNRCDQTIIGPLSQKCLNELIELYNNKYVIISPTEWRFYSLNGTITFIYLFSTEDSVVFIVCPEPRSFE